MPLKKIIICSGFCLSCVAALNAQHALKYRSLQQAVGFQEYQQRKWRMQQLPNNSYFLRSIKDYANRIDTLPMALLVSGPDWCGTGKVSSTDTKFKADRYTRKLEFYHWQKESWWRNNPQRTNLSFLNNLLSNIDLNHQ